MFEVGFSEILMVALVALLVIGPEKLPKVARMAGFWVAKTRRAITAVKQEINEEFQAEELRQALKNRTGVDDFQKLLDDASESMNKIQDSINFTTKKDGLPQQTKQPDEPQ